MVFIFSFLLITGCLLGQILHTAAFKDQLSFMASICLSFIMMEVGVEFSSDNKRLKDYGWDFVIASSAALLPALLWAGYFIFVLKASAQPAVLMGISSAPTSAGVLFAMLMAAGLSHTWVFKKARVLAVLDDLVTILLLAPIEIIIHGFHWSSIATLTLVGTFITASFYYKNAVNLSSSKTWLLCYSVLITVFVSVFEQKTNIHLEVLIPAFMWGCLLRPSVEHAQEKPLSLANMIRGGFMFLVGLTFPQVNWGGMPLGMTAAHVFMLTVLANLGKSFLILCYSAEASFKERIALGVAMFPRGEVGAAVLLIALGYGFKGIENTLAFVSLSVNLLMTGIFIWIVIKLVKQKPSRP